jgi:hypothetical protein
MSSWVEKEWRVPRKSEVVRDIDGNLGWVFKTEGPLNSKKIWVWNENDVEIYTAEDSQNFEIADHDTSAAFQKRRYNNKGYRIGALCCYKGNANIPLQILQMDWNPVRYKMTVCLKDLRKFDSEIMKTEDDELIVPYHENFPPIESILSNYDTGLKWRLEINLIEKDSPSWTNCGSVWEFFHQEDAMRELSIWKSRMLIRRVASVLNADWKISFPCWTVEYLNDKLRVVQVDNYTGAPGYFSNATKAAMALNMIPLEEWRASNDATQDSIEL